MIRTILVTGATGNIGSLVIPQLVEKGAQVRAYVRNSKKAEKLREMGVQLFEGDFSNQKALNKAAEGVDAVLALTPPNSDAVAQGKAILNAALHAGTPYYVRVSAIGAAEDAPTENGRMHYISDEALIQSGLPFTIIRPHFFMQNLLGALESIKCESKMYWGMGDGKLGLVDVRDIADCVTKLLVEGEHDGLIYTLTGPASISFYQMAEVLSQSLDKQVEYVPISVDEVYKAFLQMGMDDWFAQVMRDYSKAYSENWGDYTTGDVEVITGNEPRSFRQFSEEVFLPVFKG
ncbi:SDR family oxidoreductase [Xanthovirga aplysinae]|uniref:SDR family oxidoreductase n=1 Tax=Xanthovirga aplysinae TaxID=2529853 RepID=UPI0012BB5F04|nr:SDR family oxidoreductase [Xanthovirga aplysinae]MTI30129.1 SDR family oxidoreductase [Xanthovirga aplysinae]